MQHSTEKPVVGKGSSRWDIVLAVVVLVTAGAFGLAFLLPLLLGEGILLFPVAALPGLGSTNISGSSVRFPLVLGGPDLVGLGLFFFFLSQGSASSGDIRLLWLIIPAAGIGAGTFLSAFDLKLKAGMAANIRKETEVLKQDLARTYESITKPQDVASEIGMGIFETVESEYPLDSGRYHM
jgi:hypothetical protein